MWSVEIGIKIDEEVMCHDLLFVITLNIFFLLQLNLPRRTQETEGFRKLQHRRVPQSTEFIEDRIASYSKSAKCKIKSTASTSPQ